jgi:hypothetical protein
MPLVRLDLPKNLADQARPIADAVHSALVSAIGIPADDRFQVINLRDPAHLIIDANYLGIARSPNALIVQIYLRQGRTVDLKKALYAAIAANLVALGLRAEDVLVSLSENDLPDWSFGLGLAQYC